jgi:uncharacterized protein (DUF2126 family)
MTSHYQSEAERELHRSQAAMLARELGEPESIVANAYEQEVKRLMSDARIRDFIAVIAAKQVKDSFRQRLT